jgi:CDP-diglyceride synthetase
MMNIFGRKKRRQRIIGTLANVADSKPAKTWAGALAGFMTLTAVSAAVSSLRRKNQS